MRQRLPIYGAVGVVLAAAHLSFLDAGFGELAAFVLALLLLGIWIVAYIEYRIHERDCGPHIEVHEGWRDGEHVREVLGAAVPPESAGEITAHLPVNGDLDAAQSVTAEIPLGDTAVIPACREAVDAPQVLTIEEQAKAAVMQQQALDEEIHDRYTAQAEQAMRDVNAIAAEVRMDFDQAEWELGVA